MICEQRRPSLPNPGAESHTSSQPREGTGPTQSSCLPTSFRTLSGKRGEKGKTRRYEGKDTQLLGHVYRAVANVPVMALADVLSG